MSSKSTPPPSLSACYRPDATWFKNELLPHEAARFDFRADFAELHPSSKLTSLYPKPPEGTKKERPPTRHISRLVDVLSAVLPAWVASSLNTPPGFAGLDITECSALCGQARMRHLIALQKLWDTSGAVSPALRDVIDSGACLHALGSIFWGTKGLSVPVAFRLSSTDRRIVLCCRPINDDLVPNDYALGASLKLKHF